MKIMEILLRSCLVGLILILFSCEDQQNYLKVIPNNANIVSLFNVSEIADNLGVTKTKMTSLFGSTHEEHVDNLNILSVFIEKPENTGIDFASPICIFRTSAVYLVAKINDTNKLQSFLLSMNHDGVVSPVRQYEGLYNTKLFDVCEMYFDDETLLLCVSSDEYGNISRGKEVKNLFQLEDEDMFVYSDMYSEMQLKTANADVSLYHSHYLSKGKVELMSSLNLEHNHFVLNTHVFNADKRINKLLDEIDEHTYTLKGRFADINYDKPFQWIGMGVDGEWLLNLLKSNQEIRALLLLIERGIDIEKMIKSVNGDLSLVISDFSSLNSDKIPDITMIAEIKNADFLNDVDYWISSMGDYGMKMEKIARNQYILTYDEGILNWGVTPENELYISTSSNFSVSNIHQQTNVYAPYNVQDNKLFMYTKLDETVFSDNTHAELQALCSLLGLDVPKYLLVKSNSSREFIIELGINP